MDKQEGEKENTITFKVYGMRRELVGKLISLAKLKYDNSVAKCLEDAYLLLMGQDDWRDNIERRLLCLENTIAETIKEENDEEEENEVKTFGGKKK